ncbi:MAG: metal-dependent transcriptional regulator [Ruminococcaceae bacterium]|nr:metal-dependent transcriptional regulator [Oscillospiraceae bacterium]
MKTTESAEMYLETILLLQEKHPQVRSIDIVHQTGYSKPSVSRAVGLLKQRSLIDVDFGGYISLTADGKALAAKVLERHRIITDFLIDLGVSPEIAAEDACKMEHIISDEVFNRMKERLK